MNVVIMRIFIFVILLPFIMPRLQPENREINRFWKHRDFILFNKFILNIRNRVSVASVTPRPSTETPSLKKPKKCRRCLPLGQSCLKSKFPCCSSTRRQSFIGPDSKWAMCFKFGQGVCEEVQNISNFKEYLELVQLLNSTNFQELKKKYWDSVAPVTTPPLKKPPLIVKLANVKDCIQLGKPCLKSRYPCCKYTREIGFMGTKLVSATCFKFGKGICELDESIDNFNEYMRLAQQLNRTNFKELKQKYWTSIKNP